ncbi:family 3 adenylate cyclase [Mycolicibacterium rhodesiae NBB3]|uniref:Family 3 adenylate cyclase n=1 Tax=Mycolicibacterium rhodesiae (strain NBB3) TaxID=710685 RepID=G8RX75_MYCRN|nr:family 3 adenylate cyclase [Mycolicibacterium rhodesiae NBB3]
MPIFDQFFVGRKCSGVSPQRRLVIDDSKISRSHLEIRLDVDADQAFVIDTSTNGTSLNGLRLERNIPMPISHDDEIRIGDITLTFRSSRFKSRRTRDMDQTEARIREAAMVMVVGDITNYSAISQLTHNTVIADSLNRLWGELGRILETHRGTLNHYAGDALYAVWDLQTVPDANELAIDFALAANRRVEELGPDLPLRSLDGSPIQMGWGVVRGMAALAAMSRSVEAVIGDSTNVAFRLAGLAGRCGRRAVMVSNSVRGAVDGKFVWGEAEEVVLKGRQGRETVFPVIGRVDAGPREARERTTPMGSHSKQLPSR